MAIVRASGNELIGCTFQQGPFVFYNVISGNGGNGLRITNSNDTTVQANFMGVGANNATIVANRGDGLLVSGIIREHPGRRRDTARQRDLGQRQATAMEVSGKASGFTSFNTFAGIYRVRRQGCRTEVMGSRSRRPAGIT